MAPPAACLLRLYLHHVCHAPKACRPPPPPPLLPFLKIQNKFSCGECQVFLESLLLLSFSSFPVKGRKRISGHFNFFFSFSFNDFTRNVCERKWSCNSFLFSLLLLTFSFLFSVQRRGIEHNKPFLHQIHENNNHTSQWTRVCLHGARRF